MTSKLLWRSSAFLLFVMLTLVGTLLGTAWRRSHPSRDTPQLVVTFLDVGDGDCTLVQSPEGRTILVDTGSADAAPSVAALLRSRNVKTIDLLLLTSPEAASVGGIPALLGSGIYVSQVWDDAVADTGEARRAALEAIRQRHIPSSVAGAGDTIQIGQRLFISALWPPETGDASRRDPLLCRINYGSTAFLLEAPATAEAERDLISQAGSQLECSGACTDLVLQAATHAEGSPSPEMLRRAAPAIVVLSHSADNPPDQALLQSLQAAGAAVWRTDTQGTITVTAGGRVSPSVTATHL
ncbi:MAG: ComEC/Rec2 family competence protein [Janthinobacterium lividum]